MASEQLSFDDTDVVVMVSNANTVKSGLKVLRNKLRTSLDINTCYGIQKESIEALTCMIYLMDETLELLRPSDSTPSTS